MNSPKMDRNRFVGDFCLKLFFDEKLLMPFTLMTSLSESATSNVPEPDGHFEQPAAIS